MAFDIPPPPPSPPRRFPAAEMDDYHMVNPMSPPLPYHPGMAQGYGQPAHSPEMGYHPHPNAHAHANAHAHPQHLDPAFDQSGLAPPVTEKKGEIVSVYRGFNFTKSAPFPGEVETWTRAHFEPMQKDRTGLVAMCKKAGKESKARDILKGRAMDGAKRDQVERLLFEHQKLEVDPRVEWVPAMIKLETEKVGENKSVTRSMQVIIKRVPKSSSTERAGRPKAGAKISDLRNQQFLDAQDFGRHDEHVIDVPAHHGHHPREQMLGDPMRGHTAYPRHTPEHAYRGPEPTHMHHEPMGMPRGHNMPGPDHMEHMPPHFDEVPLQSGHQDPHEYGGEGHGFDHHQAQDGGMGKKKSKKDKDGKKNKNGDPNVTVHQTVKGKVYRDSASFSDSDPDSLWSVLDEEDAVYTPDSSICDERDRRRSSYQMGGNKDARRNVRDSVNSKHRRGSSQVFEKEDMVFVNKGPSLRRSSTARPTNYRRESQLKNEDAEHSQLRLEKEIEIAHLKGKLEGMRLAELQQRGGSERLSLLDRERDGPRDRDDYHRDSGRFKDREHPPYDSGRRYPRERAYTRDSGPRGPAPRDRDRDRGYHGRDYDHSDYDERDRDWDRDHHRGGGYSRR